ncbi:hypothetical protein EPUS_00963 [Endocarpon pusillum Z07020]|uniref:Uncharacterized protein n=1 Tax=Endocarpon pusillum (strain Z07020 / HMAS-L-300199) TaxID=1263415 RepID=U1HWE8_ENDPU|nr:uncharacterized protein EPUS_00963 [Endocarpon pusillum Z07020]ERF73709.1 hypothetical protein EPUS_00963 [Endocarpon pusillum Z07020]
MPPDSPTSASSAPHGGRLNVSSKNTQRPSDESNNPFISSVRDPKPSGAYKVYGLPTTASRWAELTKSENTAGLTINTLLQADSASEIRLPQFLVLRTIWPDHTSVLMDYLVKLGFQQTDYERRKATMRENKAWKAYIDFLEENFKHRQSKPYRSSSSFPGDLGIFGIALGNQLKIYEEKVSAGRTSVKEGFAADSKSRQLRPRAPLLMMPATPERSSGSVKMDFETPGTPSQPVPLPAEDEAIVNFALIAFLQAIWRLDPAHDTCWTPHRKAFKFVPTLQNDVKGKGFTAVTDGHLEYSPSELRNKPAAILEVKAAHRERQNQGRHRIYMQESAQMALWIAAEPDSHWRAPLRSTVDGNADRDEIFITLAENKNQYLDYLHGKPATDEAFLRMWLFGPYRIKSADHMENFGSEISELLSYAEASALDAIGRTPTAQSDHFSDDAKPLRAIQVSTNVEKLGQQLSKMEISNKQESSVRQLDERNHHEEA